MAMAAILKKILDTYLPIVSNNPVAFHRVLMQNIKIFTHLPLFVSIATALIIVILLAIFFHKSILFDARIFPIKFEKDLLSK